MLAIRNAVSGVHCTCCQWGATQLFLAVFISVWRLIVLEAHRDSGCIAGSIRTNIEYATSFPTVNVHITKTRFGFVVIEPIDYDTFSRLTLPFLSASRSMFHTN